MASFVKGPLLLAPLLVAAASLHFDEAGAKQKPISKVVDLLKEMSTRLDEDQNTDQDIMDKTKCWCAANLEEKPNAIAAAKEQIAQLTSSKAEAEATSQRLVPEIRKLEQSLQESKSTLDKAYSIRVQQMNNFKEDEASLMDSIKQVGNAAESMGAKQGSSFLQVKPALLAESLQKVLDQQSARLVGRLSHSDRVTLDNFLQDPSALMKPEGKGFLQTSSEDEPTTVDGVAGILQSMGDDFAADLQKELGDEKASKKAYEELNSAKQVEISSAEASITGKTEQKAAADVSVATADRDTKAIQKTLAADEAFLKAVQKKCSDAEDEFTTRQLARSEETGAISKAIEVLTSDAARDLSFLQEASDQKELGNRAAEVLSSAGKKLGKEALVTMAMELKGGGFEKVKQAMEDMVSALKAQQADEVKEKDTCEETLRQNELDTDEKERLKSSTEGKVATLKTAVKKAADEVQSLKAEMAEMQKQIQVAGENRMKENKEFQASIAEQKETQAVLKKAQKVIAAVYQAPSLVQVHSHSGTSGSQPEELALGAPEGFKEMQRNSGGLGVVELLSTIIEDSAKMEAEATKDEQQAQTSYEGFLADNDQAIKAMGEQLLHQSQEKAEGEADLAEAKESLTSATEELSQLKITKVQLEGDCNYLLRNFELRQTARSEEMNSIKEAKAMLSGAKFS